MERTVLTGMTAAVVVAVVLTWLQTASAQEPTPDNRPSEPPPQAINCVRPFPDRVNPILNPEAELSATISDDGSEVTLHMPAPPDGVTCFAVYRHPTSIYHPAPLAFAWDEEEVVVPQELIDRATFGEPGENCYHLYYGSPAGLSDTIIACVEVPDSVVPPTPTPPNFPTPPSPHGYPDILPPEAGTGDTTGSVTPSRNVWLLGAGLALTGAGLAVIARRRRAQRD